MVSRLSAAPGYNYRRLEKDQQSAYVCLSVCLCICINSVHYIGYTSVTVTASVVVTVPIE